MPLYFFHFTNGAHAIPDLEGVELDSLATAREYAIEDARFVIDRHMVQGWRRWRVDVTDEAGETLFSVPFADVRDDDGNGTKAA